MEQWTIIRHFSFGGSATQGWTQCAMELPQPSVLPNHPFPCPRPRKSYCNGWRPPQCVVRCTLPVTPSLRSTQTSRGLFGCRQIDDNTTFSTPIDRAFFCRISNAEDTYVGISLNRCGHTHRHGDMGPLDGSGQQVLTSTALCTAGVCALCILLARVRLLSFRNQGGLTNETEHP